MGKLSFTQACRAAACRNRTADPSGTCHHHRGALAAGSPATRAPAPSPADAAHRRSERERGHLMDVMSRGALGGLWALETETGWDANALVGLGDGSDAQIDVRRTSYEPSRFTVCVSTPDGAGQERCDLSPEDLGRTLKRVYLVYHPSAPLWDQVRSAAAVRRASEGDVRLAAPASWNAAGRPAADELDYLVQRAEVEGSGVQLVADLLDEDFTTRVAATLAARTERELVGDSGGQEYARLQVVFLAAREAMFAHAQALGYDREAALAVARLLPS